MRKSLGIFIILFFCLSSVPALGMPSACPEHYWGGQAPDLGDAMSTGRVQEICYEGYAIIYSDATETPLASAEYLTREHLEEHHPRRSDDFHPDTHIPWQCRSELNDYRHSGYDRGHMAPAGDMWDEVSDFQSFSLANMIPQNPDDNRHLWEGIEAATRYLAEQDGSLYVLTGPIFYGHGPQRLDGRVLVPTYIFKAIYDPRKHAAAAYLARNAPGVRYAVISIRKLDSLNGLSVFPGLPEDVRMLRLPKPEIWGNLASTQDQNIVP
ncbi:MAG: DNA/RNA non-specific endonuclease [Syntrophobacteraceae bacterium]